jgi:hypothetical protein
MKKYILVPVLVFALAGGALWVILTPSVAFAKGVETTQRFNLDETQVSEALDEVRAERYALKIQKFEDRLTRLVQNGKITEAQKTAILQKLEDLEDSWQLNRETFQSMTPAERKAARQAKKAELEAWAASQGLNVSDFFPTRMRRRMF